MKQKYFYVVHGRILGTVLALIVLAALLGVIWLTVHFNRPEQSKVDINNALRVSAQASDTAGVPVYQVTQPDFFVDYRLERERVRSERAEMLREVMKNGDKKDDQLRQKAQQEIMKLALDKQRELEIENMIKAKGFSDVLVFLGDSNVNAVVKAPTLTRGDVVQVADIISKTSKVSADHIVISCKE